MPGSHAKEESPVFLSKLANCYLDNYQLWHLPAIATYARIEAVSCARRWQAGAGSIRRIMNPSLDKE